MLSLDSRLAYVSSNAVVVRGKAFSGTNHTSHSNDIQWQQYSEDTACAFLGTWCLHK
jgi:hypothetical protein